MGEVFGWALYAATALLVLYALRVVMQGKDPEHPGREARLGCGFFFLACLCGGLASKDHVGGWGNAARLGAGVFLLAPAVGALSRPHGARLFLGVIGLVASIVVAGPVARDLWQQAGERSEAAPRIELEEAVAQLEDQREQLTGRVDGWTTRELELRARIGQSGHADFDSLAADPEALGRLEELEAVRSRLDWGRAKLAEIESSLERARRELDRLEEGASEGDLADFGLSIPSLADEDLSPVEEYARQKELEALFEEEFGDR